MFFVINSAYQDIEEYRYHTYYQHIHKHILIVKAADVSYSETIRLPGQYYMSKKEVSNSSSRKRASSSSTESNKRMKM